MTVQSGDKITIEVNDPTAPSGTQVVTVGVGGAAAGALIVPVTALAGILPKGAVLNFPGGKQVTTTAQAASGAVSLSTSPVPVGGLAAGDAAPNAPSIPAVFVPVNDMNRFSRRNTRSTTRTRVFMRSRPYLQRGQRETTATISGLLNTTDAGQNALRSAMNTDVPVTLRILPDGVNGFVQDFYVNNTGNEAAPDPADLQDASFELSDAGDAYAVGSGPVM